MLALIRRPAPLLFGLALLAACASVSPETRVRRLLGELERLAEEKDVRGIAQHVSSSYADPGGRDKRALTALLLMQLRGREKVHLLTRVTRVESTAADTVEAELLVALLETPTDDPLDLQHMSAELLRVQARFVSEDGGRWRVIETDWRRARLTDFLG